MPAARILQEVCVAEKREVALDENDRPIALRLERLTDNRPVRLGLHCSGRLRTINLSQGGGYVELLDHGEDAFMRLKEGHGLTEGQALTVQVVAEARDSHKVARVIQSSDLETAQKMKPWDGHAPLEYVAPGDSTVAHAFDMVISDTVPLPGGGTLSIERTRALIAADIDTAGRRETGRTASRALKINLDAAAELARQVRLRNLGGIVVLDCVGPINRDAGKQIRDRFSTVFRHVSDRACRALLPSELGLLQASIEWAETPIAQRLLNDMGHPSAETICYEGFRLLEQAARAQPMEQQCLSLPQTAHAWLTHAGQPLKTAMAEKYGDRFIYDSTERAAPMVFNVS